jgi:hypothetical protein
MLTRQNTERSGRFRLVGEVKGCHVSNDQGASKRSVVFNLIRFNLLGLR